MLADLVVGLHLLLVIKIYYELCGVVIVEYPDKGVKLGDKIGTAQFQIPYYDARSLNNLVERHEDVITRTSSP